MKAKNKKDRNCNYYNKMMFLKGGEKRNSGVSPILGMIFVILITMTTWSAIQSTQVPKWLKTVEIEHSKKVEATLKTMIEYMKAGKDISVVIEGVRYPTIPFFLTPPPPYMVARFVNKSFYANYSYILPNQPPYIFEINGNYSAFVLEIYYNYIDPEIFVIDNGMLFKFARTAQGLKNFTLLKPEESLEFILLKGSSSSISLGQDAITITLKPASVGNFKVNISCNGDQKIRFETFNENASIAWNVTLHELGFKNVRKIENTIEISDFTNMPMRFIHYVDYVTYGKYLSKNGDNSLPEEPKYCYSITTTRNITLQGVQYTEIDVLAVDQYCNPIPDFKLLAVGDPEGCFTIVGSTNYIVTTDSSGTARFFITLNPSVSDCSIYLKNADYPDKFY